jgi:processive 1,2-diacylglycerol beta-glucosyltransferase
VPVAAVVVTGRNKRTQRRVMMAAEGVSYPVRALTFVDNVYDYMHAADALVTKPGGLSTAEALVAQIPMVLCKPLPGQEERNARILVEAGAAIRTRRLEELPRALETVLMDAGKRERMIEAAQRFRRPNAAGAAAAMIARLVKLRKESVA